MEIITVYLTQWYHTAPLHILLLSIVYCQAAAPFSVSLCLALRLAVSPSALQPCTQQHSPSLSRSRFVQIGQRNFLIHRLQWLFDLMDENTRVLSWWWHELVQRCHLYRAWSWSHRTQLNCADWFGLYSCNNRTTTSLFIWKVAAATAVLWLVGEADTAIA